MLPMPHLLFFVPVSLLAFIFVVAFAVDGLAGLTPRARAAQPAAPKTPLPSAQIITFRPRQTSLPSTPGAGIRQRAMPRQA
jgi:hypothetical protein